MRTPTTAHWEKGPNGIVRIERNCLWLLCIRFRQRSGVFFIHSIRPTIEALSMTDQQNKRRAASALTHQADVEQLSENQTDSRIVREKERERKSL